MNFTYQMFSEQYNYDNMISQNGDYTGPETVSVFVDNNGNISSTGTEVLLSQSNTNHIVLMDILEGSSWFNNIIKTEQIEAIGPYINLKKENIFPPGIVYDINNITISGGVVTYAPFLPVTIEAVKNSAQRSLSEFETNYDRTSSTTMKTLYSKLITICEWIITEWDTSTIPAYKIVIPTLETIDNFNNPV